MEPVDASVVDSPTPGNSSSRSFYIKLGIFAVFVILLILAVAFYFIRFRSGNLTFTPGVSVGTEISPWDWSDDTITKPPAPDPAVLDAKYKQVQLAIKTRNYDAFKSLVSSERVWHVENPKKPTGEDQTGATIYELLSPRGKENFVRNASYSIGLFSPNSANITPVNVSPLEVSTRPDIILVDPVTNARTKVKMTLWTNAVQLVYSLNSGLEDTGFGRIGFVWDGNDWKYNGESWAIEFHTNPLTKGDTTASPITEVEADTSNGCTPSSVTIKAGQAVAWKNFTGRIYSIDPSLDYWDSGFLSNDKFIKRFAGPGIYTYLMVGYPNEPEKAVECKVVVE